MPFLLLIPLEAMWIRHSRQNVRIHTIIMKCPGFLLVKLENNWQKLTIAFQQWLINLNVNPPPKKNLTYGNLKIELALSILKLLFITHCLTLFLKDLECENLQSSIKISMYQKITCPSLWLLHIIKHRSNHRDLSLLLCFPSTVEKADWPLEFISQGFKKIGNGLTLH